ncbi:hypothetical protein L228DRAFT_236611 [Xylona heveae TC161]|uniref:Uncharacterized protein n=1 Tax=Xylona heveae (strain CBS 132557 / TC161) TaxID=1328760 RepID=A0A165IXV1_XYLHT|nr:hypothetical protein L228DRAFT_236611 [Xylona heveae TC161]KZF25523.1 hypothetical protein L228DRAFT_236611 [Xylona heveae TC161]
MSASSQTKTDINSHRTASTNSQAGSAITQTTVSQAGSWAAPGFGVEISRWSDDTPTESSISARATEAGLSGARNSATASVLSRSSSASGGSTASSQAAVSAERQRTLSALEYGAPRAPASERVCESVVGGLLGNNTACQQLSSSGSAAQQARRKD